uniref:Uncharacterized protein n=1 Tax=Callorhinchus milii TaxID=7868 RepID=A0A4W3GMF9_CALMI
MMKPMIPKLLVGIQILIQHNQDQASEAMEVFDELMESEVSIIVPHLAQIVQFCLEVGLRVRVCVRVCECVCVSVCVCV